MVDELFEYFKRNTKKRDPSFWEKIKFRRMLNSLSESDLNQMRNYLIKYGGPLFNQQFNGDTPLDRFVRKIFPERIKTLNKKELYFLNESLKEVEKSVNKEYSSLALGEFLLRVQLSYSSEGWGLKKALSKS